jgi:Uri superfamily endonuclease
VIVQTAKPVTYQLAIVLTAPARIGIGSLGVYEFPAGRYIYTGSARRNFEARIARHLRRDKRLHWHIDYLLALPEASVDGVQRSDLAECVLNRQTAGTLLVPGFGASDCRHGCSSHLKYLGAASTSPDKQEISS